MEQMLRKLGKAARLSMVPLYRRALLKGVGAGIEHEATLASLNTPGRRVSLVVDVGANVGQFALAARRWFPEARILAFEPLLGPAAKLRSVFDADQAVHLTQAAIGPVSTEMDIYVSKAVDSSSLLPIGSAQTQMFPGTEESHRERVAVAPLDTFLKREELLGDALLKIDVQGYELSVLKGCESLMDGFFAVYVECSFVELYEGQALVHEVIDWLHRRGYYLARIGSIVFDKHHRSVQGDFLFLRRAEPPLADSASATSGGAPEGADR